MKRFFFLPLFLFVFSCNQKRQIIVSDLNLAAKVIKIKTCKGCIDGEFIYILEVNPEENQYMKYISDCVFKEGDLIYFKTTIRKE